MNLLQIAATPGSWAGRINIDGEIPEHELRETNPITRLMLLQQCGFAESHRGDFYDSQGGMVRANVPVEIEESAGAGWHVPTITIAGTPHRTQDFRGLTGNCLTGAGGWYIVVTKTEGELEAAQ